MRALTQAELLSLVELLPLSRLANKPPTTTTATTTATTTTTSRTGKQPPPDGRRPSAAPCTAAAESQGAGIGAAECLHDGHVGDGLSGVGLERPPALGKRSR